jgi:cytidylate kinase
MNTVKNRIITISGEPVSGKGTVSKILIQKLLEQGYKPENIHFESTGEEFRKYFNSVVELIINFENEKRGEILQREEIKELFSTDQGRKVLSKTMAQLMAKKVELSNFSIEDANNAKEFDEVRDIVDSLIDEKIRKQGKTINQEPHPDEVWVIDSRLAFFNIPEAFSVRLTSNAKVAGERLFNDKTRGKEDSRYSSVEEAIEEREERRNGENIRYKEKYGVDLTDDSNYDLVIDTSYSSPESIADVVLQCEERQQEGKGFAKKWASPKIFLPLQGEMDTIREATYTLEELEDRIKKNGYDPESSIEVISVDGVKYIIEGHHRNFAAAHAGKQLIPYEVIAQDDEKIPYYGGIARDRAKYANIGNLYGHEWIIDNNFSYSEVYPERVKEMKEEYEKDIEK